VKITITYEFEIRTCGAIVEEPVAASGLETLVELVLVGEYFLTGDNDELYIHSVKKMEAQS
jgi:hypothetical protein